jgi:hypothetical protein
MNGYELMFTFSWKKEAILDKIFNLLLVKDMVETKSNLKKKYLFKL